MNGLGTEARPLRVAIVGAGPSGFYTAEALFESGAVGWVGLFERHVAPFGLVRTGVAPDHPKIQNVTHIFERIAAEPRVTYFGDVHVGLDISVAELRRHYDAVVFACGTETSQNLGIPGDDLPGVHTAGAFTGWYTGHPLYRYASFDLSHEVAVVVGIGNVAMDVARTLCRSVDDLRATDMPEEALDVLASSRVREVHLVGRRGPAQAKFGPVELREMGELADYDCIVNPDDLALNPASAAECERPNLRRMLDRLEEYAHRAPSGKSKRFMFHFFRTPVRVVGDTHVSSVIFEKTALEGEPFHQEARGTGEIERLDCGLVFSSIGFRGAPLPGIPFDTRRGCIPNKEGRIVEHNAPLPGCYVSGWAKTGPQGLIGANKPNSQETIAKLLEDMPHLTPCPEPDDAKVHEALRAKGVRVLTWAEWKRLDALEIAQGKALGKPRERFRGGKEMLAALDEL